MCASVGRFATAWFLIGIFSVVSAHQVVRQNVTKASDWPYGKIGGGHLELDEVNGHALHKSANASHEQLQFLARQVTPSTGTEGKLGDVLELGGGGLPLPRGPSTDTVRRGFSTILFGIIFVMIAIPIQWFNEERSAKMEALLSRGLQECVSIDSDDVRTSNRGKLVHVQGRSRGMIPVVDPQFQDALVKHCLKLQSTVEVFEWVQTTRTCLDGQPKQSPQRYHMEWTTVHHDSQRFKSPSPANPRLPIGLGLGTFTTVCKRVGLGKFVLTDEMVNLFHTFEPAMQHLPATVTAHGLTFFANPEDGYYYTRPRSSPSNIRVMPSTAHQVGDLRVRFMCVTEGKATVVAVQCLRGGVETFVPYRVIPRVPCFTELQERQRLIEVGERPFKSMVREAACCSGRVATCCCCPCNIIACCCTSEVTTEEIFYISDLLDPVEKPFQGVVQRNPYRVWSFRLIGWGLLYLGTSMILGSLSSIVQDLPGLRAYGKTAPAVLASMVTVSMSVLIVAGVFLCYRPVMPMKWLCVIVAIILVSLLWGIVGARMHP